MATGRLNLVVLEVTDVDRACALYAEAFGLDLHVDDHDGAQQGEGDRWISGRHGACTWKDGAFMHFALYEAKGDGPSRGTQIGFTVDDIDAAHARAVAAGAHVIHAPRDEPWGPTSRYRDLDNNIISLTQPPTT
jgi:predicted enzyme related to lactoylglutathione lyase